MHDVELPRIPGERDRLVAMRGWALLLVFSAVDPGVPACTTFSLRTDEKVVFGRNYDFEIGDGLVLANRRGTERQGHEDPGARWTARFGSLTFNQFGRDFPMGGMNEAGLVVELMWLDGTRYPAPDGRPALGVLEWIQFQLDTARTVEDVLASDARVRIHGSTPLHYLVSDAAGAAATIEFLGGRLVAHTGDRLPVVALTNDTYDDCLRYLRSRSPEQQGSPAFAAGSLERFATAATLLAAGAPATGSPVDRAFAVLSRVAQRSSTRWSIVYDQTGRTVHFRTDRNEARRTIRLDALDLSCASPVRMLDVHSGVSGDVSTRLEPYTPEANRDLVRRSYRGTSFLRDTPDAALDTVARHPDTSRCTAPPRKD